MTKQPSLGHVLCAQQFSQELLEKIFALAQEMELLVSRYSNYTAVPGKRMIALFYEPSTRTRCSFEMAMERLDGKVVFSTENAREFSSAAKGETLEDTIRVLCGYKPDVIVLRYDQQGGAERAAKTVEKASSKKVFVINAGDGNGQHPTQALLDLYTIKKRLGRTDNFSIAMVGDLANGRTVRSLCYLLGKFKGVKIHFVAPKTARMKYDIKEYLKKHDVPYRESEDIRRVAGWVDVIYQTRIQKERGTDGNHFDPACFIIDKNVLGLMKKHAIVMHPLPRNDEIAKEVDDDPRAAYFEQAENGLYVRMALLKMILTPNS